MDAHGLHFNFLFDISFVRFGAEPRSNAICDLPKKEIRIESVLGFVDDLRSGQRMRMQSVYLQFSVSMHIYRSLTLFGYPIKH